MKRAWLLACVLGAAIFSRTSRSAEPGVVHVVNRSQYTVLELRIHEEQSYMNVASVLARPLEIDEAIDLSLSGSNYVTFFRERYENGPIIAMTMEHPVQINADASYELIVFDGAFRLIGEEPAATDDAGCSCSTTRTE